MTYSHVDGRPEGARITPETHPCRWLAEEVGLFRQGRCSYQVEYGNWGPPKHCGDPSDPEADFGHCTEHALAVQDDHGGANWWHGLGEEHTDPSIDWKRDPAFLAELDSGGGGQ